MAATLTASFTSDHDLQRAVDALTELGLGTDAVRIITPPGDPEATGSQSPPRSETEAAAETVGLAGLAGMAVSMGGQTGASGGVGYAAGGIAGGVAAGMLLQEAFGEISRLGLSSTDARLYQQRLQEGATVVSVKVGSVPAERVAEVLAAHNAADVHTG